MEWIYPRETRQVYIPRGLDGSPSRLVLEVAHRDTDARIFWHMDERYLGETHGIHEMEVHSEPGWHHFTLVDADGNFLVKNLEMLSK